MITKKQASMRMPEPVELQVSALRLHDRQRVVTRFQIGGDTLASYNAKRNRRRRRHPGR